jgi:hypothetical protein
MKEPYHLAIKASEHVQLMFLPMLCPIPLINMKKNLPHPRSLCQRHLPEAGTFAGVLIWRVRFHDLEGLATRVHFGGS